jgi:uncharacterized protein (DUF1778 family)
MHLTENEMPTSKPRITITLSQHQHDLLGAMADAQKVSMSSIVVELLDTAVPVLERVMDLINAAKRAPKEALDELKRSLDRAEHSVLGMQQEAIGQLDLLLKEAGGMGEAHRGSPVTSASKARRSVSEKPPTSNRGVRITSTPQTPVVKTTSLKAVKAQPECTCKHTKHERMENKKCPLHFPAKRRTHAV